MTDIRTKFKLAKQKIVYNQASFLENVKTAIQDNNCHSIRALMLDKENQHSYKKQLQDGTFLYQMLILSRMEMLSEVLKDPFYKFDDTFVFDYLSKKLKQKEKLLDDMENITQFITNVVSYHLYPKTLTRVLGWFIICFGLNETFLTLVRDNQKEYSLEYIQFNHFETEEDIHDYFEEPENYRRVLILCLKEKLENLAIELIIYKGQLENSEVIESALQNNSKIFLRYIWETTNSRGDLLPGKRKQSNNFGIRQNERLSLNDSKKKSHIMTIFETSMQRTVFNQGNLVFMLSDLVDTIHNLGYKDLMNEIVSNWKFLDKDKNLLQALFRNKAYEQISILLYRYPNNVYWKISPNNFKEVIENNGLDLILLCLKEKHCQTVLDSPEIQRIIVDNYLDLGEKMYYGAELLSNVKKSSLDLSLTNDLLLSINHLIKSKNIINCHSPILTCLLLCELISFIGEISVHFSTKCDRCRNELMTFCKNIYEAKPNERYIKFLLGQKDSNGRSAFQIAAEIEAYMVLESPEVGTIVNKMWVGKLRHDGIFAFSSLMKFLENPTGKGSNPFNSFESVSTAKTYFHQLTLWEESCSLRYYPESISTILLIVMYNLFIFFLVTNDEIMKNTNELNSKMQTLLISYIVWVVCIASNIPLQILYCYLSKKRKYKMDSWGFIDLFLLVSAFLILLDTEKLFPSYNENNEVIPSDGKSDLAFVVKAAILSINDILVWLRITGILLTYEEVGPLIRMIYLLSIVASKYLLIYLILMICLATVYTTLFYKASPSYESFSITFTTLFQGYLNNSDCFDFEYYKMFGAIACLAFVTLGGLILVNVLIALLSNEYTKLSKVVDAAHRSVLITYYKRYKWDKNYGYLILLTPPLNIINFLTIPINLLFRRTKKFEKVSKSKQTTTQIEHTDLLEHQNVKQQQFNKYVSRIYYSVFYFPLILIINLALSSLLIPICYLVGFFVCLSDFYSRNDNNACYNFGIFGLWTLLGLPYLFFLYMRDIFFLFNTIFISVKINANDHDKKRINDYFLPEDIRNFLHFIHKREKSEQNDLHKLFIDYLEFEHQKKAELDKEFKNQTLYLHKLRNSGKTSKKTYISISSIYTDNKASKDNPNSLRGRLTKRNVVIIEILGNFVIDDSSDNSIVDIDKMKMLLPKTMNINNAYIKRLVHTDINSLNKAVNKRKNKDNAFLQHKLLNKIVGSVVRLDKNINAEGNVDPLQSEEAKKKYQFDVEENEDDFYSTLEKILEKISDEMKENIKLKDRNILEEEEKKRAKKRNKNRSPLIGRKQKNDKPTQSKNILTIEGVKMKKNNAQK